MSNLKLRKKTSKVARVTKKAAKKQPKKTIKLKAVKKTRTAARPRATRKPKQPAPRQDQTTVRLGPHHVDRQPIPAGIRVHPAPALPHIAPLSIRHLGNSSRHH